MGMKMGLNLFAIVLGLFKGSRKWRKASECKRLIKQVRGRLIIQKKRREAIIRQSRIDIAHLLQNGLQHTAFPRAEQLYKDQSRLSAYEQIEQFCDTIATNLRDISTRCDQLPDDVMEALASLIFAASRCGELPELNSMRHLLKQRFGQEFERVNVQLLPGNNVGIQLKRNLSTCVVSDDVKQLLAKDIEKEYISSTRALINDHTLISPQNQKLQMSTIRGHNKSCEYKKKLVEFRNLSRLPAVDHGKAVRFEDMVRRSAGSRSCHHKEEPDHRLSHVHPKLPDYDNLVAKFTDIKEDYMQKRNIWAVC